MGRRFRLALLATLGLASILFGAYRHVRDIEDAEDLLRAVATAHERVGYEGEGAWGNQWPGMWVMHDSRTGRTKYGTGPWSQVESAPSGRMPDPAAFCLDVDALLGNYRAHEGEPGRYLGRDVRTLRVEPRLEGRPSLEVLFDKETLLPLKVRTTRHDGVLLREAVFHSIFLGDRAVPRPFGPTPGGMGRTVAPEKADEEAGFPVWRPAYVPEGFRLLSCRVSRWMGPCVRALYTDGVTAFELWQRPVLLPAQIETIFQRAPGGAEFHVRWHRWCGLRALARSGGADEDGIAVERHECGPHVRFEMRVRGSDVTLVTRADLDPEEPMRVLRSLEIR
ncbi:MAG TPA: sigma-E factor regulatory protein RseB domain-containing protein [Planctomycetota bacterium]|nr:sigma-E factor regulatory protein RseB domain-containing protein [Planctomycetota bacterium]